MSTARSVYRRFRHAIRCAVGRDIRFPVQVTVPAVRHGSEYGGWWICPRGLGPDSVVYSAGIGTDISFDLSIIERYGVTIHAFDPTPASIEWVKAQPLPGRYNWYAVGVAGHDGPAAFYPPANPGHVSHTVVPGGASAGAPIRVEMKRVRTLMRELGHRRIDVLKMDIEGSEYEVLEDVLASDVDVGQLLVEFHHRLPSIGVERTRRAVAALTAAGYRIFHASDMGEEYSFVRHA